MKIRIPSWYNGKVSTVHNSCTHRNPDAAMEWMESRNRKYAAGGGKNPAADIDKIGDKHPFYHVLFRFLSVSLSLSLPKHQNPIEAFYVTV